MNTVVAAASSAGAYTYIRLYMYVLLHYTCIVRTRILRVYMHNLEKLLCQDHTTNTVITQFAL
jgi:hypothetical protein